MPLDEKDLTQIKDIVTFAVDQSEMRVSGRLDKIEGRLDNVENRLDKVDNRLDKVDNRLDKVDNRLDKVDNRLDSIDGNIEGLIETNQAFLDKFQDHEVRICKLEKKPA
jgi:archaellum component FlaC